jgi:hypothetical protein
LFVFVVPDDDAVKLLGDTQASLRGENLILGGRDRSAVVRFGSAGWAPEAGTHCRPREPATAEGRRPDTATVGGSRDKLGAGDGR